MRRKFVVLLGVAVFGSGLVPLGEAAAASGATCVVESGVVISPGISTKPSKGTFESRGGQIACTGVVSDTPVAGLGSLKFSGRYGKLLGGDTCEYGKGSGSLTASLPRVGGGSISVSGTFSFVRAASDVVVTGKLGGGSAVGNLQFVPKLGQTCATNKVTRATVAGGAVVGGAGGY